LPKSTGFRSETRIYRNCSDNSISIIHQSKEHKILAEKFKIEENLCTGVQRRSIPLIEKI
jgi:hypothetical protein